MFHTRRAGFCRAGAFLGGCMRNWLPNASLKVRVPMSQDLSQDFARKIIIAAAAAIAPLAHAQSMDNASPHFPLDLITINIDAHSQPAFAWNLDASITQSPAAQTNDSILPPARLLLLVSNQNDQGSNQGSSQANGFDLSTITSSGVRSGTANMDSTRFTPKEDNLNVVPLPPAAFVGLGMLAGIAGVRNWRNRK